MFPNRYYIFLEIKDKHFQLKKPKKAIHFNGRTNDVVFCFALRLKTSL